MLALGFHVRDDLFNDSTMATIAIEPARGLEGGGMVGRGGGEDGGVIRKVQHGRLQATVCIPLLDARGEAEGQTGSGAILSSHVVCLHTPLWQT